MEEKHKERLRKNYMLLGKQLKEVITVVTKALYAKGTITESMSDRVLQVRFLKPFFHEKLNSLRILI